MINTFLENNVGGEYKAMKKKCIAKAKSYIILYHKHRKKIIVGNR